LNLSDQKTSNLILVVAKVEQLSQKALLTKRFPPRGNGTTKGKGSSPQDVRERYNITSENDVLDAGRKLANYDAQQAQQTSVYKTGTVAEESSAQLRC
jgi:hypothetical protein